MQIPELFHDHILDKKYTVPNAEPLGLGRGTIVFKGHDRRNRPAALKFFDPGVYTQEEVEQEAQVQARLSHPNILPFHWYGLAEINYTIINSKLVDGKFTPNEATPYIAMQLANQGSLAQAMIQGQPLSAEQVAEYATDIVAGLDHAHGEGEVHRDIKPQNILRHNGRLLIADWGIAVKTHQNVDEFTKQADIKGTPEYMAPEQFKGKANIYSDLYSTGIVLWRGLAGRNPFTAENPFEYFLAHQGQPLPQLESILGGRMNKKIEAIEPVIVKATAKDPKERARYFPSMAAFGDELTHVVSQATDAPKKTDIDLKPKQAAAARLDAHVTRLYASRDKVVGEIDASIHQKEVEAATKLAEQKRIAEKEITERQRAVDAEIQAKLTAADDRVAAADRVVVERQQVARELEKKIELLKIQLIPTETHRADERTLSNYGIERAIRTQGNAGKIVCYDTISNHVVEKSEPDERQTVKERVERLRPLLERVHGVFASTNTPKGKENEALAFDAFANSILNSLESAIDNPSLIEDQDELEKFVPRLTMPVEEALILSLPPGVHESAWVSSHVGVFYEKPDDPNYIRLISTSRGTGAIYAHNMTTDNVVRLTVDDTQNFVDELQEPLKSQWQDNRIDISRSNAGLKKELRAVQRRMQEDNEYVPGIPTHALGPMYKEGRYIKDEYNHSQTYSTIVKPGMEFVMTSSGLYPVTENDLKNEGHARTVAQTVDALFATARDKAGEAIDGSAMVFRIGDKNEKI